MTLAELGIRHNERFLYEYDFGVLCQHEIRIEQRLSFEGGRLYPVYIGGRRSGSFETGCGGGTRSGHIRRSDTEASSSTVYNK